MLRDYRGTHVLRGFAFVVLVLFLHCGRPVLAAQEGGSANLISPRLCFTLKIPGAWRPAEDPGTYRSPDGKQFVEVLDLTMNDLKRYKGNNLLEKEAAALVQIHEKAFKRKLADVTLAPFESAVPGTWRWVATQPEDKRAREFQPPKRYLIDLSPDGIIVLNIQNTPDDDALARSIIATLKQSQERPCRLPQSVDDVLASVGVVSPADAARAAKAPLVPYDNSSYGWSLSYPKGWKLDDSKPEFVLIQASDKGGHCGIHTADVESKFNTTSEFVDFLLTAREKHFGNVKSLVRTPVHLPSGLSAIESMADIQGTGRSHQVFVVQSGVAYWVDCEAEVLNWRKLGPLFDRVLRSFSLRNLTDLTEADAASLRTFRNPKHPWSVKYPGGWKLDATSYEDIVVERPHSFHPAGCGIYSRPGAQFTSLGDFADASLQRYAEGRLKEGIQSREVSRTDIALPSGLKGIEVMREQLSEVTIGSRSQVVFVLEGNTGYILDCETSIRMWSTLAPVFQKIIDSFTAERRP